VLHERNFPYSDIKMLASKRSAGKKYTFEGVEYTVEELTEDRCAALADVLAFFVHRTITLARSGVHGGGADRGQVYFAGSFAS